MGVQIPPSAPRFVCRIAYIMCRKKQNTSYDQGGFEADLSACGAGGVSGANDSKGGRAWENER